MRLALCLALTIPGILLLATPALALGLLMILAGWWVYERAGARRGRRAGDDAFIAFLMVLGGLGVAMTFAQYIWERL